MFTDLVFAVGILFLGGILGWFVRGLQHSSKRRMVEELYMRKVRLAQSDQEKAVRTLNQNLVEMRSFQGRIDNYSTEIARLEEDIQNGRNQFSAMRKDVRAHEAEVQEARAQRGTLEQAAEDGRLEAQKALAEHGEMKGLVDGLRSDLEKRVGELASLREELQDRESHLDGLTAQLGDSQGTAEQLTVEREETRATLEALGRDLEEAKTKNVDLVAQAKQRDAEFSARLEELAGLHEKHDEVQRVLTTDQARVAELTKRVEELEPLEGRLREQEKLLVEREAKLNANWEERLESALEDKRGEVGRFERLFTERDRVAEERGSVVTELRAQLAELSPIPARLTAAEKRFDKELRQKEKALEERTAEISQLNQRVVELSPLPEKLSSAEARFDSELKARDRSLSEKDARLEELNARVGDLGPLPERLSAAQERFDGEMRSKREDIERLEALAAERQQAAQGSSAMVAELQTRVAELTPYPDRFAQLEDSTTAELRQLRAELDERRTENERLTASLERERAKSEERESSQRRDMEAKAGDLAGLEERVNALEPLRVELGATRVRIEELEGRLKDEREAHKTNKRDYKTELEGLRKEVADRDQQTKELAVGIERSKREAERLVSGAETQTVKREGEVARLQERIEELEPLRERVEELEALEEDLEVYAERTEKLEGSVAKEKEKLAGWKEKEKERREEAAEFKSRFGQVSGAHKKLQLESDRLRKRLIDLEEALSDRQDELKGVRGELREQTTLTKGLEAQLKKATSEQGAKASKPTGGSKSKKRSAEKDDLQKLSGVGPVLEKKLNRLGYRTYADIAELDRDTLEVLAEKLATSSQRIRRDKWQATARREHKAKYGRALA